MKKRMWRWVFTIIAISCIVATAIVIVFLNKNESETSSSNNPGITNPPTDTSGSTETYATAFSISLPETIQILVGTSVNLKPGYISVSPTSMIEKLTYEITPKSSGVVNGIKLENNTIVAILSGGYEIKFKMPKSKSTYFSKTINVLVYEEITSCPVYQIKDTMTVEENVALSSMFEIMDGKAFNISTDNKIVYSLNTFTAQTIGESIIKFSITENNVEYVYEFDITIKDKPMYRIILNNAPNNIFTFDILNKDVDNINYSVVNRDEQNVYQEISVSSSDENVVKIERINEPLIKVRAVGVGEATITISLKIDPTIKVEIKIVVN